MIAVLFAVGWLIHKEFQVLAMHSRSGPTKEMEHLFHVEKTNFAFVKLYSRRGGKFPS